MIRALRGGRLIGLIGVIRKFVIKIIKNKVFIGIYKYVYLIVFVFNKIIFFGVEKVYKKLPNFAQRLPRRF